MLPDEVWAALGALLVAALNERRANARAAEADADRRERLAAAAEDARSAVAQQLDDRR